MYRNTVYYYGPFTNGVKIKIWSYAIQQGTTSCADSKCIECVHKILLNRWVTTDEVVKHIEICTSSAYEIIHKRLGYAYNLTEVSNLTIYHND